MQTFLPYPSFSQTAKCLDYRRLGKQRIEAKQILQTLLGESDGWKNHPAVKMWRGYSSALARYGFDICVEWVARGYKDNQRNWFFEKMFYPGVENPPWLGDPVFHASHRSNLLRKAPEWYGQFGWTEPNDLSYIWPVI